MDYGDYYWGLYRDYYRDSFPHSLVRTKQFFSRGRRRGCTASCSSDGKRLFGCQRPGFGLGVWGFRVQGFGVEGCRV